MESGIYGKVLNAIGIYTKGILHNGSHMINLFNFLFGNVYNFHPLSGRVDWSEDDPTLDAYLEYSNGTKAHVIGADEDAIVFLTSIYYVRSRDSVSVNLDTK